MRRIAIAALGTFIAMPAIAAPDGAALFAQNCAACHQAQGQGVPGAFPALARDRIVNGDPRLLAAQIVNGKKAMPAFRDVLKDDQIAAILTYVRRSWGNKAVPVAPAVVAAARKK